MKRLIFVALCLWTAIPLQGQVKEEIITRFGELGIRVSRGIARFDPCLLRRREFRGNASTFNYLDVDGTWQDVAVPANGLAFTWCQVPVIYRLDSKASPSLTLIYEYGMKQELQGLSLTGSMSSELFLRSGHIRQITVTVTPGELLVD